MHNIIDKIIRAAPDPDTAAIRIDRLCDISGLENRIKGLDETLQRDLVAIISISNFLFHFLIRHPECVALIGTPPRQYDRELSAVRSVDDLRLYKYRELLKITWMDVSGVCDYPEVLGALSKLAIDVVQQTLRVSLSQDSYRTFMQSLSVIALGKLGANELNYSSDIDLMFVSVNPDKSINEYQILQKVLINAIRTLNQTLEQKTAEGFLYRVDLKLRPWGMSGPLCMAIDDTEHYYAASSEPWERFAWLRAKLIAGSETLGNDLLNRMRPFLFKRFLSTEDLDKFISIKNDMSKARKRDGYWNVKVGEGGIRDIEFFIQMLQIVNAAGNKRLQTTSTITALTGLMEAGLVTPAEEQEIYSSYIFLRRLENRLQMIDEQQTHDLPEGREKRLVLARSLAENGSTDDEVLNIFEDNLLTHRSIAKKYFDRILPGENIS